MKTLMSLVIFVFPVFAVAASPLSLECRLDTVSSSTPRKISLRDGMRETIDCNRDTCRDPNLEITMNYNSAYASVLLEISDRGTGQFVTTEYDSLKKDQKIQFTTYNNNSKRFLKIDCDVK